MGLESFYVPDAKLSVAMSMNRESLIISFLFVLRWILTKSSVSSREALILDTSRANVCRGHQVWSPSSLFQPHFFSTRHFNSRFSKHVDGEDISFQPMAMPESHQVKGFLRGWQHLDLSLAVGAIRNSTPVCLCRYGWLKDAINCRKNRTQFGLW